MSLASVDAFVNNAKQWPEEFKLLRAIVVASPLTETYKWGKPCYTFDDNNVLIIQGFKQFCALLFPKGALLNDPDGLLQWPGKHTQSAKRLCFTDASTIRQQTAAIQALIAEAIAVEKSGLKVEFKATDEFEIPEELQSRLDESPAFRDAFQALTPGRQRGYLLHFSSAKQSKTRAARVEKHRERIMDGLGLHD
ncbi:YdeI/OmpD-associated family protein [Saccharospirillum mangrovi]|uniref:YdeI/OmpD-associated family protein n=1 Tax=Saccharospirillum mangrovi TaxID=2161747 RepID=UPI000D373DDB|nr:YdeI/OmpD-associated family protein [Saccharospirillum mangrovi]